MTKRLGLILAASLLLSQSVLALTQEDLHSLGYGTEFYWNNQSGSCGGSTATSSQPVIVLDPGHSGTDNSVTDPATGLIDHDYPNVPEITEVFGVAQTVKSNLEAAGYKVVMTKNSVNDTVTLRQRADIADNANAALAVSIHDDHTQPWNNFAQIYVQQVGLYRTNPAGQNTTFTDAGVATKSQAYGQIFATQRTAAEGRPVTVSPISFDNRPGLSPGNIPEVELFATVPWVYNEVGAAPAGQTLSQDDLNKYAQGLTNSIEKAVPISNPTNGSVTAAGFNLPTSVPEPRRSTYLKIFSEAAAQYNTDPAFLASIFYIEHGGSFPDPPPPYGSGPAWATSPAGAQGPFQFEPSTWPSYKDANPNGHGDVEDLTDASYGAAKFLSAMGGTNGTPLGSVTDPHRKPTLVNVAASYNAGPAGDFNNPETQNYIALLVRIYPQLANGGAAVAIGPCGISYGNVFVDIAMKELGNTDPTKYGGHGEAWCAEFLSWVYNQGGHPLTGGSQGGWFYESAVGMYTWFLQNGITGKASDPSFTPQPGDLVYFNWSGTGAVGGANDHVGMVVSVDGTTLHTINGNWGGKVGLQDYTNYRSDTQIIGFGRFK